MSASTLDWRTSRRPTTPKRGQRHAKLWFVKRQAERLRDEQIAKLSKADASRMLDDGERMALRQLVTLRNSGEVDGLLMPAWTDKAFSRKANT